MPINILMPALSPTMETGNLAKWHVKEGDAVKSGDVIAEIETDKATMEVEAVDEGTVAKIVVAEGATDVPVNNVIAILAGEGEDAKAAGCDSAREAGKRRRPRRRPQSPISLPRRPRRLPPKQAPKAEKPAAAKPVEAKPAEPAPQKTNGGGRIFASPLARSAWRRRARSTFRALAGSGPHGRIVQRDIEAALKGGVGKAAPAPAAAPSAGVAAPRCRRACRDAADPRALRGRELRARPARIRSERSSRAGWSRRRPRSRISISRWIAASTSCWRSAPTSTPRAPMKKTDAGEAPLYKLSVNDLVIKAMAMALMAVPDANVTWTEGGMLKHKRADVGVAVSIPGGLITPVVRNAETKTLSQISNEMKDLAARARKRKLKPEEYQGGSTAVSNLGMFGVKDFAAVINPPHATILAVGAGEERAIVEKGEVKVATLMTVTMSTDHRAVDGALGAELLAAFKRYIEAPAAMLA